MFARAYRFHLIVDLCTAVAVLALLALTRNPWGAQAGFALLSLHAIAAIRHPKGGVEDERAVLHRLIAWRAGMATTWVLFVLTATVVLVSHGTQPIPSWILGWMIWVGWLIQSTVGALVALRLDRVA